MNMTEFNDEEKRKEFTNYVMRRFFQSAVLETEILSEIFVDHIYGKV